MLYDLTRCDAVAGKLGLSGGGTFGFSGDAGTGCYDRSVGW